MADMIKFYRGLASNLPTAGDNGALYITTDEGAIYYGTGTGMKRLGDFLQVDNVAALPAQAHESCLYYCVAENILAKWNGTEWKQINKQPTAEELKTLLSLGSLAYLSEVSEDNLNLDLAEKIELASKGVHEHTNKSVIDSIDEDDVDKWNAAANKVHTHANADELAKIASGDVEKWNNKVDKEPDKSLVEDNEIAKLASVSEGANKVEASENGKIKIDGVDTVVYTHPDKHAIADVDGLETALAGKSDDGHKHVKADITDFAHNHEMSEVNGLADALAGKQDVIPEGTYDAYGSAAQALTDAKAYVDSEDVFHTDITTVNALGGIAAGADLDGMTTHEILNTLLFPYVAFVLGSTSRSAAAATLENGATQTLNSASISITKKSKPITSVKLMNGSTVLGEKTGDDVAAGGTISFSNLGITVSKSNNPNLKFTVTDGTTSTDKNVGASTFVYPYYMGECAANATIDETLIEGLTKKVESKGNKTVTHSCENGRMIIAYPKAHGVLKSILDPNNFETIGDYTRSEVSVTGLDGTTQTYYVYASGAATVSGFKVQYKY